MTLQSLPLQARGWPEASFHVSPEMHHNASAGRQHILRCQHAQQRALKLIEKQRAPLSSDETPEHDELHSSQRRCTIDVTVFL
jgi:hypothetical protein